MNKISGRNNNKNRKIGKTIGRTDKSSWCLQSPAPKRRRHRIFFLKSNCSLSETHEFEYGGSDGEYQLF